MPAFMDDPAKALLRYIIDDPPIGGLEAAAFFVTETHPARV